MNDALLRLRAAPPRGLPGSRSPYDAAREEQPRRRWQDREIR